jgi:hypothetical protein
MKQADCLGLKFLYVFNYYLGRIDGWTKLSTAMADQEHGKFPAPG